MTFAVLFPGQGSQFVGMGAELFERRPDLLGERADAILGWSLLRMCLEGPEEALTRTEHAQPALFAVSYTLWGLLAEAIGLEPAGGAGHSLGEYTALAAADALAYDDALDVVARRGRAMAAASDLEPSGMAALVGADEEAAAAVVAERVAEGGRLQVANINAPGQVVVAGGADDIAWLTANASRHGVRRAIPLKVAGAFHTQFMAPAAEEVAHALAGVEVGVPRFPIWSNTTGRPHRAGEIADVLVEQVVSPVRFGESLQGMAASGIEAFVHVGPGAATAGLARRAVEGAEVLTVSSIADIGPAAEAVVSMA